MQKWFFTFGCGQTNAGFVQPIIAENADMAREQMFATYGAEWCFQYSEQEWEEAKTRPNRWWPIEKELPTIIAEVQNVEYTTET